MRTTASTLTDNMEACHTKGVISDALSVPQVLPSQWNKELGDLAPTLYSLFYHLQRFTEKTAIQWIPLHCNIPSDEEADRLEKEGRKQPQQEQPVSYVYDYDSMRKQKGLWSGSREDGCNNTQTSSSRAGTVTTNTSEMIKWSQQWDWGLDNQDSSSICSTLKNILLATDWTIKIQASYVPHWKIFCMPRW